METSDFLEREAMRLNVTRDQFVACVEEYFKQIVEELNLSGSKKENYYNVAISYAKLDYKNGRNH